MVQLFTSKTFSQVLFCFQELSMIAAALFSLPSIGNRSIPRYMANFYWYPLVADLLGTITLFFEFTSLVSENVFLIANRITLVFHFAFLGGFILHFYKERKVLKAGRTIFYFFLILTLVGLKAHGFISYETITLVLANFGLISLACLYYYELFEGPPVINLIMEPSFWVMNGIFIGLCPSIPIIALRKYLDIHLPHQIYISILNMSYLTYGVMYLLFIKAYLCAYKIAKENKVVIDKDIF